MCVPMAPLILAPPLGSTGVTWSNDFIVSRNFPGFEKKTMILVISAIEGGQGPPLGRPSALWCCLRVHQMVPLPSTNPTPCSPLRHPILFSQRYPKRYTSIEYCNSRCLGKKTGQQPHSTPHGRHGLVCFNQLISSSNVTSLVPTMTI